MLDDYTSKCNKWTEEQKEYIDIVGGLKKKIDQTIRMGLPELKHESNGVGHENTQYIIKLIYIMETLNTGTLRKHTLIAEQLTLL